MRAASEPWWRCRWKNIWGQPKKINITVPRLVLARIDECARKHGQSRSGFLVEATRPAVRL